MTLLELMERPEIAGTDFVAAVARYFVARPGQWIDGRELAKHAGAYGWRTRLSQARHRYGMTIENRVSRIKDGDRTFVVSEYRFVPEKSA